MSDIATELAKLHTLSGAAYSKQVERIARTGLFHPVEGEQNIFQPLAKVAGITRAFSTPLVRL
ncbi:MAG: hypothetical protein IKI09_00745 [Bacteroidales bacterium]|nr:hypothetical protein [Bacteroidales bacterium]